MDNSPKTESQHWLLLRGLVRGQGHWGRFPQMMQAQFPQSQILCLDLPGNGLRSTERSPLSIHDFMTDLRERCPWVKEGVKFQVLALSMGAMIAVDWMHCYPHEISKSYLVCTSSARHSRFYQRFHPRNLLTGFPLLSAQTAEEWERGVLSLITNNEARRQEEWPQMVEFSRQHPVQRENLFRQLFAASQYRFPKRPPGEVQLIGSYGDRLVSPQCTLSLAKAWGLEAVMHPSAGHDIPIDDPRWLLEQLL